MAITIPAEVHSMLSASTQVASNINAAICYVRAQEGQWLNKVSINHLQNFSPNFTSQYLQQTFSRDALHHNETKFDFHSRPTAKPKI